MTAAAMDVTLIRRFRPERTVMQKNTDPGADIRLDKRQLLRATGNNRWRAILCLDGAVWITQPGDARDHVLEAGEMFLISQAGAVIVQGLVDARLRITSCLASPSFYGRFEDTVWP